MTRTFAIVLIPQENGTFAVQVPALPEVNSQGRTRDEALERVSEAIELAIEQRLADGADIPTGEGAELEHVTIEAA
ncbi:MAG: type II toxin-antitoxin system HicB family antitoxin [Proteobacteria bacterium]|nr:type II toxin-antitoxin system HicB family antitoxin [Pseudomonadota bacterium]